MDSTLTPNGWVVDAEVVDERNPLPRLTQSQIDTINARIAGGSNNFPTGTRIVRVSDEVVLQKEGVGAAGSFDVPSGRDAVLRADLAKTTGSGLLGHDDTTVADRLNAINLADYTAMRAYTGKAKSVQITGYLATSTPSGIAGLFTRDDSDTTSADNGVNVFVDALGRRWKRPPGPIKVEWAGAKEGEDCTAAVAAAIAACGPNDTLEADGDYMVDSAVFSGKTYLTVNWRGSIRRNDGKTGAGVRIYNCQHCDFWFGRIDSGVDSTPADYNALTGAGLELANSSNNRVVVRRINGFAVGIDAVSETAQGVFFNDVRWGEARYCKDGLRMKVADGYSGFVNGNNFYGGDLRVGASAVKTMKGSAQTDPFNGNNFYAVHVEQAVDAFDLDFMRGNQFFGPRIEPSPVTGRWLKTTSSVEGNTYHFHLFPLDKMELNEKGARYVAPIYNSLAGMQYGSEAYTDKNGGLIHVVCHADSATYSTSSNGVPVRNYFYNADVGIISADKGVTALKIIDASGTKRVSYRQDAQDDALNADLAMPYGTTAVRVQTNVAAVKLFMKAADFYAGRILYIDVTNFANSLTIRNEADTADYLAAGQITGTGMWMAYVTKGLGMRVKQLA